MAKRLPVILTFLLLASCALERARAPQHPEMRGVWVATVNNIDWPSRRDLTPEQQQDELRLLFDRAVSLDLNTIFLQVRPASDAMYASSNAPWSEYLTGTMGSAPEPAYDPLAFAIAEAHRRGLQLHAWFNPFRARAASGTSPLATSHIAVRRPDLVVTYGNQLWLDPGHEDSRREIIAAICDVVRRYDVDGVHMDDYFYPYPIRAAGGGKLEFPDDASWQNYQARGGTLKRDDWRRDNINTLVRELYANVKAIREDVVVGISPFGIWRPRHPPQIRGLDAYADIYADSRLWLRRGWVDYLAPQLYWPIDRREQSFSALLEWWLMQDRHQRGIVAGISVSRVASGRANAVTADEIARQIAEVRRAQARGFILFSARALMENRGGVNERIVTAASGYPP